MVTAPSEKKRHEAWTLTWRPSATLALLLAFGLQPSLPFVYPPLLLVACASLGVLFVTAFDISVLAKRSRTNMVVLVLCLLASIGSAFGVLVQADATLREIEKPCNAMRARIEAKPTQDDAAGYEALHCPVWTALGSFSKK
jgi:hypothetical protein